jgi:hypothetical protein
MIEVLIMIMIMIIIMIGNKNNGTEHITIIKITKK